MNPQDARARFLQDSARMLFLSSASTSRLLSFQSLELAHMRNSSEQKNGVNACTACGGLLIPGWTTKIKIVTSKVQRKRAALPNEGDIRTKLVSRQCSFCKRVTRETTDQQWKPRGRQNKSSAAPPPPAEETVHEEIGAEKASKVSSKKRAKARKEREGLQALLNKSAQSKGSPGLSLLDMMQR